MNAGVEHSIKVDMTSSGKSVMGFETAEQQFRYFADAPPAFELEFFKSSVEEGARAVEIIDSLVAAWEAGDETKLEALLNREMRDKHPAIYSKLIVERSERFAEKIAALAKGKGVIFVAVGAGHLVGADSIQADLAKLGFKAERQ